MNKIRKAIGGTGATAFLTAGGDRRSLLTDGERLRATIAGSVQPNGVEPHEVRNARTVQISRGQALATTLALALTGALSSQADAFDFDTSHLPGYEVLTAEDGAMETVNMVVVKYAGPIAPPMAANLRAIWDEVSKVPRFEKFVLRLNSPGGVDLHGMEAIEVLRDVRQHMSLVTLVAEHDLCASMCIALFVQGDTRYASPASSWMFHGASASPGSPPSLHRTMRYFEILRERDIDQTFIGYLFENHYVTTPGTYWLSGSELADQSNIITNLLPNWKPVKTGPSLSGGRLGPI